PAHRRRDGARTAVRGQRIGQHGYAAAEKCDERHSQRHADARSGLAPDSAARILGPRRQSHRIRFHELPATRDLGGSLPLHAAAGRAGHQRAIGVVMAQEFSFDVVSKTEMQEVANAIQQAQKELAQRFDFKGSKSSIELTKDEIVLVSDDEGKLRSLKDILETKLIKRGVSLKAVDYAKLEDAALGTVRQKAKIVQGIESEKAKAIVKAIKDAKLKVQASIQSDQVRVTGRNKDDLQKAISLVKEKDFGIPRQFTNYRG